MEIIIIILAMAAVTYIPRALPAVLIDKLTLGRKARKFLGLIPYTAMAALIFPGVLTVDENFWHIGAIGGCAAALLSVTGKISSAAVVIISVAVVMCVYAVI